MGFGVRSGNIFHRTTSYPNNVLFDLRNPGHYNALDSDSRP